MLGFEVYLNGYMVDREDCFRTRFLAKGSACWNTASEEVLERGLSIQRSHNASSERLCTCLRIKGPATNRVGNGG
jgi:hypothetical protein